MAAPCSDSQGKACYAVSVSALFPDSDHSTWKSIVSCSSCSSVSVYDCVRQ